MKPSSRNALLAVALFAILAAGFFFARGRVHFDWNNLAQQLRAVDWKPVALAVAAIYLSAVLRAFRWRLLLGRVGNGSALALAPAQIIGFTVVALFGRVADLARPYLIARRTETAVATQLAVYSIERAYDLAAAAILFSLTLAFAPKNMPHHENFVTAGRGALLLTSFIICFALAVRFAGETLANLARRWLCIVSKTFAEGIATRIVEFRDGLRAVETGAQLFGALLWSLVIWVLIAYSYYATAHAFRSTPALAGLTIAGTMLLMASSMAGSLFQLPIVGWFTQIGVLAAALHLFFDVPLEAASAGGALMLIVTTLVLVPGGLVMAKIEGVGLRDAASSADRVAEANPAA